MEEVLGRAGEGEETEEVYHGHSFVPDDEGDGVHSQRWREC